MALSSSPSKDLWFSLVAQENAKEFFSRKFLKRRINEENPEKKRRKKCLFAV
jgi:hypothetical protein